MSCTWVSDEGSFLVDAPALHVAFLAPAPEMGSLTIPAIKTGPPPETTLEGSVLLLRTTHDLTCSGQTSPSQAQALRLWAH